MSKVEKDVPSFEHTGDIKDVPPKDDVKESKIIDSEVNKIEADRIKENVRRSMGEAGPEEPKPVGTMTKDCPQLVFRLIGGFIGCKKFELDDAEANTMAAHLNILIPMSGKLASVVIILMITLNKVYLCLDAIKAKMSKEPVEEKDKKEPLPEPLS